MNGTNLFKIALRALNNNKLRAFLTMLGIIIGVASVITMLAIGQGSKKSIQAQISEMGSNMIMIHPGADMRGGVRQDPSAMQTLKLTDYEALRNETNFLAAVSPNVSSSGQLIAGNNNYPSSVSGVGTDYLSKSGSSAWRTARCLPKPTYRPLPRCASSERPSKTTSFPEERTPWDVSSASTKCPSAWWAC